MLNPQTSHQPPRFVILFIRDQLTVSWQFLPPTLLTGAGPAKTTRTLKPGETEMNEPQLVVSELNAPYMWKRGTEMQARLSHQLPAINV